MPWGHDEGDNNDDKGEGEGNHHHLPSIKATTTMRCPWQMPWQHNNNNNEGNISKSLCSGQF